jgi:acyl dehydratase
VAVDPSFAGRSYAPAGPYVGTREAIAAFAEAVGATQPAHTDLEAARALGYDDVVAPPTFLVTVAQAAEAAYVQDPAAGIDFTRVVHADERFVHHRPVVAGDELVATLHVEAVTLRGGLAMVTTRVAIADATGAPVSDVTSTLAVRPEES